MAGSAKSETEGILKKNGSLMVTHFDMQLADRARKYAHSQGMYFRKFVENALRHELERCEKKTGSQQS